MSKNSTARKVQSDDFMSSHFLVVKPNTEEASEKVINFKASAEDTSSETIAPEAQAEPQVEQTAEPTPAIEAKPIQSIEDIKRKSEVLSRLTAKWDRLAEKRRRVENFSISHDGDTASAIIKDAQGEVFESNSPKTIGQLIEFWKAEFSEAIAQVEKEMREIA
jgi:hypothetical protein